MASNTYNLNTWSAKRIFGDASITTNTNALLQLTNNNSWLLNSGRSSVYGVKYVYDGTNNHDKIEFYGGYQVNSTNTPTIWTQLDTGDIYILGKVGVGQDPNSNYKLYVDGDTYISGKTYFDDLVGIDYDPATSGNTYKLYVNGSSCYAGDIIPSTTHTYSIGTSSLGWNNIYNQALSTRTIDAAPVADWSDSSVYIGYGAIEPTNAIRMYYSTDTSTRTEFFRINSDGSYALTRFGVNGQSTSYNLYVDGTANITSDTTIGGHLYLSVAAKHLYMKYNNTNYNIINNHNNANISVNAASGGLFLGYTNTTSIDFLNKKVTMDASGNTVIAGTLKSGTLTVSAQNSTYEGGEIILNPATSSYATIHLDSYQNQFRIHNGSSVRLTVDLSTGQVAVKVNTASTSKTTGALIVAGGVGVSGTVYANAFNGHLSATPTAAASFGLGYNNSIIKDVGVSGVHATVGIRTSNGAWTIGARNTTSASWVDCLIFTYATAAQLTSGSDSVPYVRFTKGGVVQSSGGDFAEYRKCDIIEPGRVVVETGMDGLTLCQERLAPATKVISDTYGSSVGECRDRQTPVAVSGRVLVYPYKDREKYKPGDAVCSALGGTVDIMTRDEIIQYPDRIVGIVSDIPSYDVWYMNASDNDQIPINGRIWIYVR